MTPQRILTLYFFIPAENFPAEWSEHHFVKPYLDLFPKGLAGKKGEVFGVRQEYILD